MKYKGIILVIICILLSSTLVSADLNLRKVVAIVDGNEEVLSVGEEIFVRPGSVLQIKATFENEFTKLEDTDIDISMEGEIFDIDGGSDIREEDDLDLESESSGSIILTFNIPRTTIINDYDLSLEIDADDDDGASYSFDHDHQIEIIKAEHEVLIDNIELSKTTIE